jgi:hypothetical protein
MTTITNDISGAKGKGQDTPRTAVEAKNSLQTETTISVVELISEGEIEGLVTGDARSIYFNDTPLQNADLSNNFGNVIYDFRAGLASQTYMTGFPDIESEVMVGTVISYMYMNGVSSSQISAAVNSVKFVISFPSGLSEQNTTNGDINGSSVTFQVERQLEGAIVWEVVSTETVSDKSMSNPELTYSLDRPAGVGNWFFRIKRLTEESVSSAIRNTIAFARYTQIQDIQEEYPFSAYVGIKINAKAVGNSVPVRSYDIKGVKIQVPSNYNPITRVYTGIWNGLFNVKWCDNPAWVLYDLITHPRYGMGDVITASMVDKYSFYDAAVYNDAMVSNGSGGTEPRYTFNYVIQSQEDGLKLIQTVAGSMQAIVMYSNGTIWVKQDRPSSPVKLITNANVIDGLFSYVGTQVQNRHTVARVTYNDKSNKYLIDTAVVEDADGIARYGYMPVDIAAYGATTHGQALRVGKWVLDTELHQTDTMKFKTSFNGFDLLVGDVIKVLDQDLLGATLGGKIVSATAITITLDRPVTLSGASSIDFVLPDGTVTSKAISVTTGTLTVLPVATLSVLPNNAADFIITTNYGPALWRVHTIRQTAVNEIEVNCLQYDPNKYSRIETGYAAPINPYKVINAGSMQPATGVTITPEYSNTGEAIIRKLRVSWTASSSTGVNKYLVIYRRDSGTPNTIDNVVGTETTINSVTSGTYQVSVIAVGANQMQSRAVTASYILDLTGTNTSTLNPVSSLVLQTGGTTFNIQDCNVQWTNPTTNVASLGVLKDFRLDIYNNDTTTLLRTVYPAAVGAGEVQKYSYTFANNRSDTGNNPARHLLFVVRCRDASNNLSTSTSVVFTNPAPAVLNNLSVSGIIGGFVVEFDPATDSDVAGYMLWKSTTNGFTANSSTLVYTGSSTNIPIMNVSGATTYYFKAAAYDNYFWSNSSISTLNLSSQFSATSVSNPLGVPIVSSLSLTGTEGQVVSLTTDGKLYRYHSGAWTAAVPSTDISGTISSTQISDIVASKITGLLSDSQLASISSTKLVGNIVASQVANISAPQITGTLTSAQIASVANTAISGTLTNAQLQGISASKLVGNIVASQVANIASVQITGTLTSSQIANITAAQLTGQITTTQITPNSITTALLAVGSVTANTIAAGSITSSQIAANTITGTNIQSGTITATNIAANSITASQIAANTITSAQIAAGTITASNILANTITGAQIAAATITGTQIAGSTITGNNIVAGTITAGQIAANTITGNKLVGATITGNLIAANTITASSLVTNSITATQIAAGTITATQIAASTITGDLIAANTVSGNILLANSMYGNVVMGNTLYGNTIIAGTLSGNTIIGNTIYGNAIVTNSITASQIAAGTITATQIAASSITASQLNLANVDGTGNIRSGMTGYLTGSGFWLGTVGGVPKFSIGNSAGSYLAWDGTSLLLNFSVPASSVTGLAAVATTGTLPASSVTGLAAVATGGTLSSYNVSGLSSTARDGIALQVNGGGTFTGALSAASGTFAGTLTASAINAVDTINIAGQAVSISTAAASSATVNCGASPTTYVSCVMNSSGGTVTINASIAGQINTTSGKSVSASYLSYMRVLCDGAQIGNTVGVVTATWSVGSFIGSGSFCYQHTPGAGSHTYSLQMWGGLSTTAAAYYATGGGITLLETKR